MIIPEHILRLMTRVDRLAYAQGQLPAQEAIAKANNRLERQEQKLLCSWLALNAIPFDQDRMDRRRGGTAGWPDFCIVYGGRVLLGEMKVNAGKLSEAQRKCHDELLRTGTEVQVWNSADEAIRQIKNWMWTCFRQWPPQEPANANP